MNPDELKLVPKFPLFCIKVAAPELLEPWAFLCFTLSRSFPISFGVDKIPGEFSDLGGTTRKLWETTREAFRVKIYQNNCKAVKSKCCSQNLEKFLLYSDFL
jgi:hypothetical protein